MHTHDTVNKSFIPYTAKAEAGGESIRAFQITPPHSTTPTETSSETTTADIQARIDHAARFGHDLTRSLQPGSAMSIQRQAEPTAEREEEEETPIQRQVETAPEQEEEEEKPIQAKLTIGQPGDKYEQEADAISAKVMAMPEPRGGEGERGREGERERGRELCSAYRRKRRNFD